MEAEQLAVALLTLWKIEGSMCSHGVGLDDCPDEECEHNEVRPALRAAEEMV